MCRHFTFSDTSTGNIRAPLIKTLVDYNNIIQNWLAALKSRFYVLLVHIARSVVSRGI